MQPIDLGEDKSGDRVHVHFVPSSTGKPHIGNIRIALFSRLFARASGGVFVLRVEDTDWTT